MTRSQVGAAGGVPVPVPAAPVCCVTTRQGKFVFLTYDGSNWNPQEESNVPPEAMRFWVQGQPHQIMIMKWGHTPGGEQPQDELRTHKDEEVLLVGPYTVSGKADPNWPAVMNKSGAIGRVPFNRMYGVGRAATVAAFAPGSPRACVRPEPGV